MSVSVSTRLSTRLSRDVRKRLCGGANPVSDTVSEKAQKPSKHFVALSQTLVGFCPVKLPQTVSQSGIKLWRGLAAVVEKTFVVWFVSLYEKVSENDFLKKSQKPIDIVGIVCYNIIVR